MVSSVSCTADEGSFAILQDTENPIRYCWKWADTTIPYLIDEPNQLELDSMSHHPSEHKSR
jgi:hypothetical protein